jgi:hypothetical protein
MSVILFTWDEAGIVDRFHGDSVLQVTMRPAWHRAVRTDPRAQGELDLYDSKDGAGFLLVDQATADWGARDGSMVACTRTAPDSATMVLTSPDGKVRTLRRAGPDWTDAATGTRYRSLRESQRRFACCQNLSSLAQFFVVQRVEAPKTPPKHSGVALPLSWRKAGRPILPIVEGILRCPGDPDLRPKDAAWTRALESVDLGNPPLDLCSYAFRDFAAFPLDPNSPELQPIACDRQGRDGRTPHHAGGICVAFEDGSTRFFEREELGLKDDEPIVVGPDSKAPWLRVMCQIPPR